MLNLRVMYRGDYNNRYPIIGCQISSLSVMKLLVLFSLFESHDESFQTFTLKLVNQVELMLNGKQGQKL